MCIGTKATVWDEGEDVTSVVGHRLLERPLVVDSERVDDAAADGRGQFEWVQTDGILPVEFGSFAGADHLAAEILDEDRLVHSKYWTMSGRSSISSRMLSILH